MHFMPKKHKEKQKRLTKLFKCEMPRKHCVSCCVLSQVNKVLCFDITDYSTIMPNYHRIYDVRHFRSGAPL